MPSEHSQHRKTWLRLAVLVTAVAGLFLLYTHNPVQTRWALKCPFKLLTGFDCGGCGSQRALYALMHGRLREAVGYNIYMVYAVPYALLLILADCAGRLSWGSRTAPSRGPLLRMADVLESKAALYFYIASYIVWMVVRNILHI